MTVRYYGDHTEKALQRLRPELRTESVAALLDPIMEEVQVLEDVAWAILTEGGLDEASGDRLDAWGDLVGQPRNGQLDGDYRRFIRARLRTNRSSGTTEDVVAVVALLTDAESGSVRIWPRYPAGIGVEYTAPIPLSSAVRTRVRAQLLETVAAGVAVDEIVEGSSVAGLPFAFVEYDAPSAGFGEGIFAESF